MTEPAFEGEEDRIRRTYAARQDGDRYSPFNPGHAFIVAGQERAVLDLLRRSAFTTLDRARILDVGCGTGAWLLNFLRWGARPEHLTGLDLLPDRLAEARQRCPPAVTLRCGSAASIGDADASFDIVTQFTVFTSIADDDLRRAIAAEMLRVLKPDGVIIWYDFHVGNPANPDVRAVSAAEIRRLFPQCEVDTRRVTLAPPLARALAGRSRWLCEILEALPMLRTHTLARVRRQKSDSEAHLS